MLHFFQRAANTVANAAANKLRLFADTDGLYKIKDSAGVIKVLGNGIKSIVLQSTVGLSKTYRITRDDDSIFDFVVTDGRAITSITAPQAPGVAGALDTYTINYNDNSTSTFVVRNGTNGLDGQGQPANAAPPNIAAASSTGTTTAEYALEDHTHGHGNQAGGTTHAAATTTVNGFMSAADKTKLDGIATGAQVNQNAFSVITGNTGTATADAQSDTVAITGGTGISTAATDTPDGLVITNTDRGSTAVTTHEGLADPHPQYTTTAEASAAAPVQSVAAGTGISVNATTGSVTVTNADRGSTAVTTHEGLADPHPQYTTTAEAAAAAPVQSVAGKTGAVTLTNADVGLGNVRNPAVLDVRTVTAQTLNQTLTTIGTITIPANSLVAGDAFEIDVIFGTLVNTTAASNLEVAIFLNGTQNAIAIATMGTTAVAAPGRGGRALFKAVFRTVGANGTALANGTIHVNNIANFASNNVTAQTVNTTANITLDVRARTSVATTTGTVQMVAIEQCT